MAKTGLRLLLLPFVLGGAAQAPARLALELATNTSRADFHGNGKKVDMEFFIMSKCPSAQWWEQRYLPVLQQVPEHVNVKFTYIATSAPGEEVTCMHGPGECAGNRQRLCMQKYAKDTAQLLGFAHCQGRTAWNVPNNGEECARSVGFDWQKLYSCAEGPEGKQLLQESTTRSSLLGIGASCTVLVENQVFQGVNAGLEQCGTGNCYGVAQCLQLKVCCSLTPEQRASANSACSGFGL